MKGKCSREPAFHLLRWDHLAAVKTTVMLQFSSQQNPLQAGQAQALFYLLEVSFKLWQFLQPESDQVVAREITVISQSHPRTDSNDQVKRGRDSQSPFSTAEPLQTTLTLLRDGSCPDLSSCGDFGPHLTLQTPSTVVVTQRGV